MKSEKQLMDVYRKNLVALTETIRACAEQSLELGDIETLQMFCWCFELKDDAITRYDTHGACLQYKLTLSWGQQCPLAQYKGNYEKT